MSTSRGALLRACLLAAVPITAFAQQPVVVEAESGTLGANLTTGTDSAAGVNYITVLPAANSGVNPTPDRVATYTVTFPAAGNYALYLRFLAGPVGGNDDSFYLPTGFNTATSWTAPYNTSSGGATAPNATVPVGGNAGQNVWKWQRMTPQVGGGGGTGPSVWVVPADQLTQTFSWGSREDGLLFDKLAFGPVDVCYTVGDLDAARAPTGVCPPLPPPVPPAYTRTGAPLATGKAKFLGSAWSPGGASLNFGNYWNQVTPENGGKWASVEGTRDTYNFTQAHQAEAQAQAVGGVFKWHVLFWGNQQPTWMWDLTPAEQLEEINEWLSAIATEFPNLQQIEVVNEPLHDLPDKVSAGNTTATGGSGGYYEALGGAGVTGHDWIINAFTLARQYFPNAKLMLNDYSITNDGNATTRYLQIIQLLKDRNLIDLVGVQAHAFEFNYNNLEASAATHRANLLRLQESGLPVYATEFDIDGVDPVFGVQDDNVQLQRYQALFPVFWESPAIKGITMWGYVQGGHWRTNQGAWLMYPNGAERPALQWLVKYVENNPPTVNAGQAFTVNENLAPGSAIGTVIATDTDTGQTLSQWQLTDASGKFAIDPATGAISLAAGASLDFESATSYSVSVSVYDGYTRSASETVTINVTNLNDNPPVITAGQSYRIDGGSRNRVAQVLATDADDTNQPGFTTFSGWAITSGNTNTVFRFNGTGNLQVGRPLLVDWRRTSYTLGTRVSDGANNSAVQTVQVTIPNRVNLCLLNAIRLEAPKATAPLLILLGADLGSCR
jgi:endo-1,4-beta-xylanase